ncbi:MAG: DsbA family protein [Phycisphaerales bacterium]|jgi:protein-disulfide isomerase
MKKKQPPAAMAAVPQAVTPSASKPLLALALACCVVGLGASLALVLKHFGAVSLPGCGAGGGCDAAAKSVWGSVLGVPLSIVGMAHFAAMTTVVLLTRGRVAKAIAWGMRLAAAGSLVYFGIALGANLICSYCLAVHAANLLLLVALELGTTGVHANWIRQAAMGSVAAAATYAVLVPVQLRFEARARFEAESQLAASTQEMAAATTQDPPAPAKGQETAATPAAAKRTLEGRFRFGPEVAPVRIVLFTDYQCPDCLKIERELDALMKSTPNISVGVRYFPLSSTCNPAMSGQDLHPNACWAARAAQTAGMLRGTDGFWEMHRWLFSRQGSFTDAELVQGLQSMGYDAKAFQQIMTGDITKTAVAEDVAFGLSLGIYFTPMIFINGVELRGWSAPQALTRAVQATLAANPVAAAATQDAPADARTKYLDDWRSQPEMAMPQGASRHTLGPADANVQVVLVGDYSEKNTGDADGILRLFTSGPKPNIRYSYVHYPIHTDCNPTTQINRNATACLAAKAAEAADVLGGPEAFWAVHGHLMAHQDALNLATIREAAGIAGVNADDLMDAMEQPFVNEAVRSDAQMAMSLGIRSLPMIYINGRLVPRWKLNNENMLAAMIFDADGTPMPAK